MGFLINLLFFSTFLSAATSAATTPETFLQCMSPISNIVYTPNNSSYTSILEFSIQNFMFISSPTPKPQFIITPTQESHIQSAVVCSKKHGLLIRVRSGGHDYEGLSYTSPKPFVVIDLINFKNINVSIKDSTAWVQAGATVGELYYRIAEQSNTHAFAAGVCTTMGVGGHIGGGGIGFQMRKFGIAADNVLDARFVDVNGRILDRKSMGEDLFWAIRGGGGASFGVILAWKLRLVPVPSTVTYFNVAKNLNQGATSIFFKWQNIAHTLPQDLLIRTLVQAVNGESGRTIQITFESLFLGNIQQLLPIMQNNFPELGLTAQDCTEMSWINSTITVNRLGGQPLSVLLNRTLSQNSNYHKGKSDFVKQAISVTNLESIWKVMMAEDISPMMINEPMGGRLAEISESAIPFPHRSGNLYNIQYSITWFEGNLTSRYLASSRRLYNYMTPYVSKSPRTAYVNYKDLDLGVNKDVKTNYSQARVWGEKYFKSNFARLASVKSKVDPENFFWNEQSIPLFSAK